jgi:hypothetical protein
MDHSLSFSNKIFDLFRLGPFLPIAVHHPMSYSGTVSSTLPKDGFSPHRKVAGFFLPVGFLTVFVQNAAAVKKSISEEVRRQGPRRKTAGFFIGYGKCMVGRIHSSFDFMPWLY